MSFIIDTHCHLSGDYSSDEIHSVIQDAKLSGVRIFFDIGYDMETNRKIESNIIEYDDLYGMVGIHPDNVKEIQKNDYSEIIELCLSNPKIIGIGEIGLDYFHMISTKQEQKDCFIKQLKIAKKLNLAVSIHLRDIKENFDAYEDCYNILKSLDINQGILHCFSGDYTYAKKFISLGLYISFSGIVTFKNAKLTHEVAKKIPIEKILVETDAPYLAPEPYRGTRNYPKYINYTIKRIAKLKSIPEQELISQLRKNISKIFGSKIN